jgi:hypothetical protein
VTGVPGTVGRPGWTLPRAPGRLKTEKPSRLAALTVPPIALHAIAFFALALFASLHWAALVEPQQSRRALVATLVATIAGVLIGLSGRLPRAPGTAVRIVLIVAAAVVVTTAMGIRFKLLMPAGWDTLHDRVSGGLASVGRVNEWPYKGHNVWLGLTTMLAVPLVFVPAAAAAFWPRARDDRSLGRAAALVLLVTLYGVAVAARPFDLQALRGIGLLACLAVWLWLPRLRGRDAAAAAGAIGIAAVLALLLTPQVASRQPWVDYRHWSWTLHKEKTIGFDWRHSYGPLHWPRKGTTLLLIKSKNPHYWKAETLDRFDGRGWTTSPQRDPSFVNTRISDKPGWTETVRVTLRGLRSDVVIGPGSLIAPIRDLPSDPVYLSNEVALFNNQLKSGDSYTVTGYTPDPSVKQMRAAPSPSAPLGNYTTIQLADPGGFVSSAVEMPLRGRPYTGDSDAFQRLEASRYADTYDLARRIAGTATTQYDIVRRIGAYLERNYDYSERVPSHRYPLDAFLFRDKKGYCQHFAGAAALMLRMLGIPVRVASGFAPGTLDNKTKEYVVTDLDAHSWIEVWFEGIGWVPFDPTPAQAPASSQAASFTPLSEIASAARGDQKDKLPAKLRADIIGDTSGGARAVAKDDGLAWGWIAGGIVVALLAAIAVLMSVLRLRHGRRPLPPPCGDAEVDHLVRLLARAGLEIPAGTTLLGLEARMQRLGGDEVAGYAERLRRRRFGATDEPPPGRAERKKLRQALAEAIGAGPLARLHLAMPDNLVMRAGALDPRRLRRSR